MPAESLPLPPDNVHAPTELKPDDDKDRYKPNRGVELTTGTKTGAKRVEGPPLEVNREAPETPAKPNAEPTREDLSPEEAKAGKPLNPALLAAVTLKPEAAGGLSASEREKALAAYDELLKRLPPAERQKLREYYRLLRDIR